METTESRAERRGKGNVIDLQCTRSGTVDCTQPECLHTVQYSTATSDSLRSTHVPFQIKGEFNAEGRSSLRGCRTSRRGKQTVTTVLYQGASVCVSFQKSRCCFSKSEFRSFSARATPRYRCSTARTHYCKLYCKLCCIRSGSPTSDAPRMEDPEKVGHTRRKSSRNEQLCTVLYHQRTQAERARRCGPVGCAVLFRETYS